jgi:putative endonuclease
VSRTARQQLGAAGEHLARKRLETLGYVAVASNWRCPSGELDLVMRDGDIVVFVEVKTRHGEAFGAAEDALSAAQTKRLLHSAQLFLSEHADLEDLFWRVDLVAITLSASGQVTRFNHLVNAIRAV